MSKEGDQREDPQQGGCRAQNRQVRPLTLGFDAEMGAGLLEGDFQQPAQDKPFDNLWSGDTAVRAKQRLGRHGLRRVGVHRVCDQHPAQRHGRHAGVIPERSARGQVHFAPGAAIPGDGMLSPDRVRVMRARRQVRLPCPFLAWRTSPSGWPGRSRIIERRIQAQPRHDCHGFRQALTGRQQFQGGIRTIRRHDQLTFGQPGPHLGNHLPRPIGKQLILLLAVVGVAFRRRQDHQEGQCPHALRPGNGRQQHHADPSQATGLHEERLARPHSIPVDAPRRNFGATTAFNVIIKAENDRRICRHKGGEQQAQQHPLTA